MVVMSIMPSIIAMLQCYLLQTMINIISRLKYLIMINCLYVFIRIEMKVFGQSNIFMMGPIEI